MIKSLLLLLVFLVVLMLWRGRRRPDATSAVKEANGPTTASAADPTSAPTAAPMVLCKICGVHLPQADAIVTPTSSYCSHAHYQQGEG